VTLAIPVHLAGLFLPSLYRDPAVLLPQNLGTDLITLCIGVPLLAGSALVQRRGSLRARVLWLGSLGFLVYDYGMYAMAVRWNPLFLAYLTLFALSLFALIIGVTATDAGRIREAIGQQAPVRAVATYLIVIAAAVGAMWLAEEVKATASGTVPPTVTQLETPTNIVHVFDLGIVLPAMVLAAIQLLRKRAWAYLWSGVLLVKAATIGLWVVAMIWFSAREGYSTPAGYTGLFLLLAVAGAVLAWRFLNSSGPVPQLPGREGAESLAPPSHMVSCNLRGN
jgi:hypothetical protein